jgi:hypothetical protein
MFSRCKKIGCRQKARYYVSYRFWDDTEECYRSGEAEICGLHATILLSDDDFVNLEVTPLYSSSPMDIN